MERQSVFVHGNAIVMQYPGGKGDPIGSPHTPGHQMNGVSDPGEGGRRIEWSDILGLRSVSGVTFRGRRDQRNTFFVAVPTPAWREPVPNPTREGVRAKLARVAVNFSAEPGVDIEALTVSDGPNVVPFPFPDDGVRGYHSHTWERGINYFEPADPPEIGSCVCLAFRVYFGNEGDIQFNSVGCDFLV
jgi:hypothetical protein